MSYLALARKWRPSRFEDVVGQSHVVTALANALKQNRLHHAYLFSGTRGVGKTSIGRLFAKGLNCETGITDTPCGVCDICKEIDEGRHVDLLEIDAASRTKVEDTRELLDNVQYKPARGRFKIYLIDEVHMLSRHSFNALLKTLEEPPEYVKFLLATTDPQKLPVTILSRCLQFHLKPIQADEIQAQLNYVLTQESVSFETRALSLIAHAADGSMRDALSLSDQAIALGNAHLDSQTVSQMLGTLDTEQALNLLDALHAKQADVVMQAVNELALQGVDWDGLLKELIQQVHRVAMYQALPASLDKSQPDAGRIEILSQQISPEQAQLYYQICLKGREDLALAPKGQLAIEMLMLRLIAFIPKSQQLTADITLPQPSNHAPSGHHVPSTQPKRAVPSGIAKPASAQNVSQNNVPTRQSLTQEPQESSVSERAVPSTAALPEKQPKQTPQPSTPNTDSKQPASASPLTALRHQLRSRRDQGTNTAAQSSEQGTNQPKKTKATPSSQSVVERIAAKHANNQVSPISSNGTPMSGAGQVRSNPTHEQPPQKQEAYRWQPTVAKAEVAEKPTLTPSLLKKSLAHEKTPAMVKQLAIEACEKDPWAKIIASLQTEKLVEQLALNATYAKQDNVIHLGLRPNQAHLNTAKAQQSLAQVLSQHFEQPCEVDIQISEQGMTPLELRESLYQQRLQQAFDSLSEDPHVNFFIQQFSATIDEESVRPHIDKEVDETKSS